MLKVIAFVCVLAFLASGCDSSSGGSQSPTPTPVAITPTPSITPLPAPSIAVTISGSLTFDFVPQASDGSLNYSDIQALPIRGVVVQALDSSGQLHAQSVSNEQGNYALRVGENIDIAIRVLAEMQQGGLQSWHVSVTDNTQNNSLYVMQGEFESSGEEDAVRNLHAISGWTGQGYEQQRVAAPFAILDATFDAIDLIANSTPEIALTPLQLRWSTDNIAVDGINENGEIGTSHYDLVEKHIYILGDENNDTDEYDRSVIQHEWSHYFDDNLSRSDSIGGAHSLDSSSDMRLAFSEGFANAFSAIASGQHLYRDSRGIGQSLGFDFSLEANSLANAGWFSENSVGRFVYDLVDENNESGDALSLDYANILSAIQSDDYVDSDALTSIYLFSDQLTQVVPEFTETIGRMLNREAISGRGRYGEGETNDSASNIRYVLPIYHVLAVGGVVEVCGNNSDIEYNGFDNRRFIRFSIDTAGDYEFSAQLSLGTGERDPDMLLHDQGETRYYFTDEEGTNVETGTVFLPPGDYVLEVFDYLNIDTIPGGGTSCFDVSIEPA